MIKLAFFGLKLNFNCHNQVSWDVFHRCQTILQYFSNIAKTEFMEKKLTFAPVCDIDVMRINKTQILIGYSFRRI